LLLSGMDDISFTLNHKDNIAAFEARFAKELPSI
jgi:3-isopropylmalate dehydratase small subunit